jgi:hypothetical protein
MSAKSVGYTVFELDGVALGEEAFEKAKLNPKEAKLVGLTLLFGIFVYIGYELFKPKPDSALKYPKKITQSKKSESSNVEKQKV